jgi:hypothetical protein
MKIGKPAGNLSLRCRGHYGGEAAIAGGSAGDWDPRSHSEAGPRLLSGSEHGLTVSHTGMMGKALQFRAMFLQVRSYSESSYHATGEGRRRPGRPTPGTAARTGRALARRLVSRTVTVTVTVPGPVRRLPRPGTVTAGAGSGRAASRSVAGGAA